MCCTFACWCIRPERRSSDAFSSASSSSRSIRSISAASAPIALSASARAAASEPAEPPSPSSAVRSVFCNAHRTARRVAAEQSPAVARAGVRLVGA
jgi:hypothetical protein